MFMMLGEASMSMSASDTSSFLVGSSGLGAQQGLNPRKLEL